MENRIPAYLFQAPDAKPEATGIRKINLSFLDKTLLSSAHALKAIYLQAENAGKTSVVHNIHPYIKLFSLIYLAVIISISGRLNAQLLAASLILVFYVTARVRIYQVYRKIFLLAFLFGFLVVFPAALNVITPGKIILNLITLDSPRHFWIYHIPQHIGFTKEGFQVVSLIFLRVLNSISVAFSVIILAQMDPKRQSMARWYKNQQILNKNIIGSLIQNSDMISKEKIVAVRGVKGLSPWSNTDAGFIRNKIKLPNKWVLLIDENSQFYSINYSFKNSEVHKKIEQSHVLVAKTSELCEMPDMLLLDFDENGAGSAYRSGQLCGQSSNR